MARFFSNSNLVALLSIRRGYSSAASAVSRSVAEENIMMRVKNEGTSANIEAVGSCSWVPDPVTGYYRPANRVGEMDPAELRRILLSRKSS